MHYWLPHYLWQRLVKRESHPAGPVHLMLCVVDHFEPANGNVGNEIQAKRVRAWTEKYPKFADTHRDADGKPPQHTWFYPPHLDHRFLSDLVALCRRGYGEIEMHLHHNHMKPFPDTAETLREKILKCIDEYSKHGIFCSYDSNEKRFGFIHGDWSLDNACGNEICGVNSEISVLRECGCYADFTFPSLGKAQPSMVNIIYYVKDEADHPKSYNWGKQLVVDGKEWGDLLMIPGIVGLRWKSRTHTFKPSIESSNLDAADSPTRGRLDFLIENSITISGRLEWRFIKLHTHGAREETWDCLMGDGAEKMFSYLESNYNDGVKYVLHYVTAREMYNIAKAAEAGMSGNPNEYRNYEISMYSYK